MSNNGWIRLDTELPPMNEEIFYCDEDGLYGVAARDLDGDFYEHGVGPVGPLVWWRRIDPPPELDAEARL